MQRKKITWTTGTRAEYGAIRPILELISKNKKFELFIIVTGMHLSKKHGFTISEIKKDGFKIYSTISTLKKEDSTHSLTRSIGESIVEFSKIFHKLKPDINVIVGDRDEMLASAIAASHMNIINVHIQGGDKSGGIDEYNRHAITKLSNIHFAATKMSRDRIIKMGENPKYVFHTGAVAIDEILKNKISTKEQLRKKYGLSGNEILLLQHPVTTQVNESKKQITNTLDAIVRIHKKTIAISPNSDPGNNEIFNVLKSYSKNYNFIKLYQTFPRSDYLGLLQNCAVLVGNSSSGIIEASYFNTPVVNIGIRQLDREQGPNVFNIDGKSSKSIYEIIMKAMNSKNLKNKYIYGRGNASEKIVKHLEKLKIDENLIQKQITY